MQLNIPFHFVLLPSGSLGHFVLDTEIILYNVRELQKEHRFKPIFLLHKLVANPFFAEQLSMRLSIWPFSPFFFFHRLLRKLNSQYRFRDEKINNKGLDVARKIHESPPLIRVDKLSPFFWREIDEHSKKYGFDKLVCMIIRDSGYDIFLGRTAEQNEILQMRHTPATEFIQSIKTLNARGYLVVRIGRHIEERLSLDNPGYLELSDINHSTSPSIDFEIVQNSSFLISTGSGPDNIGLLLRKPVFWVNCPIPATYPRSRLSPIALLPDYVYRTTNQKIPKDSVLTEPLFSMSLTELIENGIEIHYKKSGAINAALETFLDIVTSSPVEKSKDKLVTEFIY